MVDQFQIFKFKFLHLEAKLHYVLLSTISSQKDDKYMLEILCSLKFNFHANITKILLFI